MPEIPDSFANEAAINPPELKPFYIKQSDGTFLLDAGATTTGARLNPALETTKNSIQADRDKQRDAKTAAQAQVVAQNKEIQDLTAQLATSARVTPEEAAILQKIKPLNLEAAEVEKRLTEFPTLNEKVTQFEQSGNVASFAKAAGVNPDRFAKLWNNPNLSRDRELVKETETVNGKQIEKAYFKVKKADGTTEKVDAKAYIKADPDWSDFDGFLAESNQQQTGQTGETIFNVPQNLRQQQQQGEQQQQQQALSWLPQNSTVGNQTANNPNQPDIVGNFLEKLNQAPTVSTNPFQPSAPPAATGNTNGR